MQLTIYHTNDLHSHFDKLAQISEYIRKNRKPGDLYLDSGDLCDLSDIMVQGTEGKGAIRVLKGAGADAMAVGNNEIDLAKELLEGCAAEGLPLLSCNVTDREGRETGNIRRSLLIERMGVRILVIGCSPYYGYQEETATFLPGKYNTFFEMGDLKTVEPEGQIRKELETYRGKYDFCILLSHSGFWIEEMLVKKIPEINLCLGGHSHTVSCGNRYLQNGSYGAYLGKVTLEIEDGKVQAVATELLSTENFTEMDKTVLQACETERREAERMLDQTLYTVEELPWDCEKENLLTNLIADALYAEYPCDLAFTNAGIVEGGIAGAVSKKKLVELSPSKLNPTRFPVKGSALKQAVLHSFEADFVRQHAPGAGVRWTVLGTLGFSHNVRIRKEPFAMYIDGKPLEEERIYMCVAHDALQRGTGYPELAVPDADAEFFYGFIRDLLERTLQKKKIRELAGIKRRTERVEEG